jgi:hypothetical protein
VASPGARASLTARFINAPRSAGELVRRGEHVRSLRVDGRSNSQPVSKGFDPEGAVSQETSHGRQERRFAAASQQGELSSPRPSAGEAPHHGNRLVGCRAVEGHERERNGGTFFVLGRWADPAGSCAAGPAPHGRFFAVDSPDGERRRGKQPHGRPTRSRPAMRRLGGRRSGVASGSLWESERPREETTRPHSGRGRPRTGTRQGPYSKGVGGAESQAIGYRSWIHTLKVIITP